jgi:hypothetical protein
MTADEKNVSEEDAAITEAHERVLCMEVMKFLGVWFQGAEGVMNAQGEAVAKMAMRVVGQMRRGGLCKGGLSPAVALDHAEHKFLSAVSYGALVWAYVGLSRNGIGAGWAGKVEKQQVILARTILSAPERMPAAVVLGEVG